MLRHSNRPKGETLRRRNLEAPEVVDSSQPSEREHPLARATVTNLRYTSRRKPTRSKRTVLHKLRLRNPICTPRRPVRYASGCVTIAQLAPLGRVSDGDGPYAALPGLRRRFLSNQRRNERNVSPRVIKSGISPVFQPDPQRWQQYVRRSTPSKPRTQPCTWPTPRQPTFTHGHVVIVATLRRPHRLGMYHPVLHRRRTVALAPHE